MVELGCGMRNWEIKVPIPRQLVLKLGKAVNELFGNKKERKRTRKLLPYVIAWNEQDDRGYIVGMWFKYFKTEHKRRRWCVNRLERSYGFAGYCGCYNFE